MSSCGSMIMPADYEMLVSHSPPVYSRYLTDNNFCTPYGGGGGGGYETYPRFPQGSCRSLSANSICLSGFKQQEQQQQQQRDSTHMKNRRPCLVTRNQKSKSASDLTSSSSNGKKKVVFADDKGMSLTQIRIMTEPSNVPPLLSSRFLAEVTKGLSAEPEAKTEPWEITFQQPASDYVGFRAKLDELKVSLENVIVKESEDVVTGTIKVSNISYEKEVLVRFTSDSWETHQDVYCTYATNQGTPSTSAPYVLYDTFTFKLTLPPKSKKIEFCICFRVDSNEFWDNNSGRNYTIAKKICHITDSESLILQKSKSLLTKSTNNNEIIRITSNEKKNRQLMLNFFLKKLQETTNSIK